MDNDSLGLASPLDIPIPDGVHPSLQQSTASPIPLYQVLSNTSRFKVAAMELATTGDIRVDVSSLNVTEDASSVRLVTSRVLGVAEEKALDYDRPVVFRIVAHIMRGDPNGLAAVITCHVAHVCVSGYRMCGDRYCNGSNDGVVSWSQAS
ncbi:hypothetical protein B0O80DRAFT_423517 [Mortierella sp. GBAus27b]|nr:hypothetical protein B0O80DRAFT_423517 [Mortierella sp. GBAus27b]